MIRFLLLGGRWGPVPWQVFVVLGFSCLGAAGLFWALYPRWTSDPVLGGIEEGILGAASVVLVAIGARRRQKDRSNDPRSHPARGPRTPPPRTLP